MMNQKGFSLVEILLVSVGTVIIIAGASALWMSILNSKAHVEAKSDAEIEIKEMFRKIQKAIAQRKADTGPVAISSLPVDAFPDSVSEECKNTILNPPCTGLSVRQTSPKDSTGGTLIRIDMETICDPTPRERRPEIPSDLALTPSDFSSLHASLCCEAGALPVVRFRQWNDENSADSYTDTLYPLAAWGSAACFRLNSEAVSVELGAYHRGSKPELPGRVLRKETIFLSRPNNVEVLPN